MNIWFEDEYIARLMDLFILLLVNCPFSVKTHQSTAVVSLSTSRKTITCRKIGDVLSYPQSIPQSSNGQSRMHCRCHLPQKCSCRRYRSLSLASTSGRSTKFVQFSVSCSAIAGASCVIRLPSTYCCVLVVRGEDRVASLRRDWDRLVYSHLAASGSAEKSQEICSRKEQIHILYASLSHDWEYKSCLIQSANVITEA